MGLCIKKVCKDLSAVTAALMTWSIIRAEMIDIVTASGKSMLPTLNQYGSSVLVIDKISLLFNKVFSNDIVILTEPISGSLVCKRVLYIAPPNSLYVIPLENSFNQSNKLNNIGYGLNRSQNFFTLPKPNMMKTKAFNIAGFWNDSPYFFVQGDNYNASVDSRFYGPVPFSHIIGIVRFVLYPFYFSKN